MVFELLRAVAVADQDASDDNAPKMKISDAQVVGGIPVNDSQN